MFSCMLPMHLPCPSDLSVKFIILEQLRWGQLVQSLSSDAVVYLEEKKIK